MCGDLGYGPIGGGGGVLWGEGQVGLVIECHTVIGHWTQTKEGLKRICCVCAPPASSSSPAVL